MTGQPPPNPRPSRDRDLGFDELLAVFVALAAIGSILFWGLTRRDVGFNWGELTGIAGLSATDDSSSPLRETPSETGLVPPITPRTTTIVPSPVLIPSSPASPLPPVRERTVGSTTPLATPVPSTVTASPVPPVPIVVAPPPATTAVAFPDVPEDYWAYPFIADLSRRGIISGLEDGTFQPDQPVNRAQYASLIQGILPPDQRQEPIEFSDIEADFWAAPAIDAAVKAGFLKGFPDGTFQPDQPVSHVQVLASLVNGIRLPQTSPPDTSTLTVFTDADQIPAWAVPIVTTATQEGLVINHPNPDQLQPNEPATRAEVAATIYQALEATGQVEPIQSRYIVQP